MGSARVLMIVMGVACLECGPPPGKWAGRPPGPSLRPFPVVPEYLLVEPPEAPPGNVGRWDARVAVAGDVWRPAPDRLAEVRLRLAEMDEALVSIRFPSSEPRQGVAGRDLPVERLAELAARVRALVYDRPELTSEADELAQLSVVVGGGLPNARADALSRMTELVDLIRLQISATTPRPH